MATMTRSRSVSCSDSHPTSPVLGDLDTVLGERAPHSVAQLHPGRRRRSLSMSNPDTRIKPSFASYDSDDSDQLLDLDLGSSAVSSPDSMLSSPPTEDDSSADEHDADASFATACDTSIVIVGVDQDQDETFSPTFSSSSSSPCDPTLPFPAPYASGSSTPSSLSSSGRIVRGFQADLSPLYTFMSHPHPSQGFYPYGGVDFSVYGHPGFLPPHYQHQHQHEAFYPQPYHPHAAAPLPAPVQVPSPYRYHGSPPLSSAPFEFAPQPPQHQHQHQPAGPGFYPPYPSHPYAYPSPAAQASAPSDPVRTLMTSTPKLARVKRAAAADLDVQQQAAPAKPLKPSKYRQIPGTEYNRNKYPPEFTDEPQKMYEAYLAKYGEGESPLRASLKKTHYYSRGWVKFFDGAKGYGFIVDRNGVELGADIFVHYTGLAQSRGFRGLTVDEEVEYTCVWHTEHEKYQALVVHPVSANGFLPISDETHRRNAARRAASAAAASVASSSSGSDDGSSSSGASTPALLITGPGGRRRKAPVISAPPMIVPVGCTTLEGFVPPEGQIVVNRTQRAWKCPYKKPSVEDLRPARPARPARR
ncbi:hypothetical protein JCM8097_004900 [Rhodosporidiobolus ruineniae]